MLFSFLSASDFIQDLATCIPFALSTILVMESTAIPVGVFVAILDLPATLGGSALLDELSTHDIFFAVRLAVQAIVLLPMETPTLSQTIHMLHPLL